MSFGRKEAGRRSFARKQIEFRNMKIIKRDWINIISNCYAGKQFII